MIPDWSNAVEISLPYICPENGFIFCYNGTTTPGVAPPSGRLEINGVIGWYCSGNSNWWTDGATIPVAKNDYLSGYSTWLKFIPCK